MTYNKSETMKNAHNIRKSENCNMSIALCKAWTSVKIEIIDNRLSDLNMIDRQSASEKEMVRKLNAERTALSEKIKPVVKEVSNPIDAEREFFESMGFVWSNAASAYIGYFAEREVS